jgi:creatinine amidohydrolase
MATQTESSSEIYIRKHTRREFRERMASGELQACILPVAAIEQHLEHMEMEHDWRSVSLMARLVAESRRPNVLIAEGLMAGISEHHMTHPGTMSLRPGTFLTVLNDLVSSVVRAGFTNLLVLNGHGGNMAACHSNWDQFLREFKVNLHFLSYWDLLGAEDAELLEGGSRIPDDMPGHAQEFETSIGLAYFPENVRQDMWTDQVDQSPSLATAEKGKWFTERIVQRVGEYLDAMISGKKVNEVPPYYS